MTRVELAKLRRACADDIASGMPVGRVMEKYGWKQDTIRKACAAYGVSLRNNGMKGNMERVFQILARLRNGLDQNQIAEEFCISRSHVSKVKVLALKHGVLDEKEMNKAYKKAELDRIEAKWRRKNPLRNG